jgi:hypothetical protein
VSDITKTYQVYVKQRPCADVTSPYQRNAIKLTQEALYINHYSEGLHNQLTTHTLNKERTNTIYSKTIFSFYLKHPADFDDISASSPSRLFPSGLEGW